MIQTVKSIDPLSFGKIHGATLALLGLLVGGIITIVTIILGGMMGEYGRGMFMPGFFGAAAIIVLPISYGVIGFIVGIVSAFFYNVVARVVGGIKIDLSE